MQNVKLRVLAAVFYVLLQFSSTLQAQLSIDPDPSLKAVCPGLTTYAISNFNPNCHTIEISQGLQASNVETNPNTGLMTFNVEWFDEPEKGKITIKRKTDTNCSGAAPTRSWDAPIKSIKGLAPTLSGPTSVAVGIPGTALTYTAELKYKYRGIQDDDPFLVKEFIWTVPQGWTILTPPSQQNGSSISVLPNNAGGGAVTVKGKTGCSIGQNSSTASLNVTRVVPPPCPLTTNISFLLCGDKTPFGISANPAPLAGVTGIEYIWTIPQGWTILGPGNTSTIVVQPDGITSGQISVKARVFGLESASCTISIPYEIIVPSTVVVGPEELCVSGDYLLNITPPQASNVTWAITRVSGSGPLPVIPENGSGSIATLNLADYANPGECTITFTISNECGTVTRSKNFFAGRPGNSGVTLDGNIVLPQVTFDNFSYYSLSVCPGSHWVQVFPLGDTDGCVDWTLTPNPAPYPTFVNCNKIDIALNQTVSSPCLTLRAIAENVCGNHVTEIQLCPRTWKCNKGAAAGIMVFPNPASAEIHVVIDNTDIPTAYSEVKATETETLLSEVQVFDLMGNLVYQNFSPLARLDINVANWKPGAYILKALVNNETISARFVVQNQ